MPWSPSRLFLFIFDFERVTAAILFCASSQIFFFNGIDFQINKKKKKKLNHLFHQSPNSVRVLLVVWLFLITMTETACSRSVQLSSRPRPTPLCVCSAEPSRNHSRTRGSESFAEVSRSKVPLHYVVISFYSSPACPSSQGAWPPDSRAKRKEDPLQELIKRHITVKGFSVGYF